MAVSFKDNNSLYISDFKVFEKNLNGEAASWVHTIRKNALSKFNELGFPTTRHEEWKYTNIAPIAKEQFKPVSKNNQGRISSELVKRFTYGKFDCYLLVFVDGILSPELSRVDDLPRNAKVESLAQALVSGFDTVRHHFSRYASYEQDAFTALSTAFVYDGAFIHIPDNTVLDKPIHLLFLSSDRSEPYVAYPRNLIVAGKNSVATVLETFAGTENVRYLTNTVTEIYVDEYAVLDHYKIQEESEKAYHISSMYVYHNRKSTFSSNSVSLGGLITRNNPTAILDAEGVESTLNGLYLGSGKQLIDNHTTIDHAKPYCNSHELYKGILDGHAHGVFNGKIFVRLDAQKTDAKQTNQALLLSDNASIDTKPQLEIFADDVKCTHGATIGQLDENALFYLRSRGIEKELARDILTYAFAGDVIDRIKIKNVRDYLHHRVLVKLQQDRLTGIDEE
jgi:Fe-S cluster assembly protein SufD